MNYAAPLMDLSSLTIVIPTFERPQCLAPQVRFWENYACQVIFLDGSAVRSVDSLNLPWNFHYIHSYKGFTDRLQLAVEHIKTKYVIIQGDDEFHLPKSLLMAANFLENNSNFSACTGRPIGFTLAENGEILFGPEYDWFEGRSIEDQDAQSRLINHLNNYLPITLYSLTRREHFSVAMGALGRHSQPVFAQDELLFESIMVLLGKVKIIESLQWMRSHVPINTDRESEGFNPKKGFLDFWTSSSHLEWKEDFIRLLSESVASLCALPEHSASRLIETAFEGYVLNQLEKADVPTRSRLAMKVRNWFTSLIPSARLKKILRRRFGLTARSYFDRETLIQITKAGGIVFDSNEFDLACHQVRRIHGLA